jgi:hypothetical protein
MPPSAHHQPVKRFAGWWTVARKQGEKTLSARRDYFENNRLPKGWARTVLNKAWTRWTVATNVEPGMGRHHM